MLYFIFFETIIALFGWCEVTHYLFY
jgi:hypothetical protein